MRPKNRSTTRTNLNVLANAAMKAGAEFCGKIGRVLNLTADDYIKRGKSIDTTPAVKDVGPTVADYEERLKAVTSATITIHSTVVAMYDQMIQTMAFQDTMINYLENKKLMTREDRKEFKSLKHKILNSDVYKSISENLEKLDSVVADLMDDDIMTELGELSKDLDDIDYDSLPGDVKELAKDVVNDFKEEMQKEGD